ATIALPAILLMEIVGAMIATIAVYRAGESLKPWSRESRELGAGEARG
ncbi:MAG TPA: sodium:proton exchanger, partial [Ramlibacter sp.]|nr:sodium:proton exchanger [Ramlibacter sp.]